MFSYWNCHCNSSRELPVVLFALAECWEGLVLGLVPHGCFIQGGQHFAGKAEGRAPMLAWLADFLFKTTG